MVVLRLREKHLFVAVDGLSIVLLAKVDVSQFLPGLSVLLIHLDKLVQDRDRLIVPVHVSVESDKTFDRLFVEWILLDQVNQDVLGLVHFAFSLVEHGKQTHHLDGLRELFPNHLKEELCPLHLVELASGKEKLLHDVKVYSQSDQVNLKKSTPYFFL